MTVAGRPLVAWAWRVYLVAAIAPLAVYYLLPDAPEAVSYELLGIGAGVAVLVGVRLNRPRHVLPWLLLAAAQLAWVAGDVLWGYLTLVGADPFPSVADVFYLARYPLAAIGLAMLVWRRGTVDWRMLCDAAIVTVALMTVGWVLLVDPLLADPNLAPFERVVALAYPLGDALLLAVLVPALSVTGHRPMALVLLLASLAVGIAADALFTLFVADEAALQPTDAIYLVSYALWGAAALHPSMSELPGRLQPSRGRLTTWRLAGYVAALGIPPAILAVGLEIDASFGGLAVIGGFAVIAVLVFVRVAGLVGRLSRQEDLYRTVVERSADAIFLVGGDPPTVHEANAAAFELLGGDRESVRGLPISTIVDPAELPRQRERIAEMRRTGEPVLASIRMRGLDGRDIDVEMSEQATQDGLIVAVARDVTAQRALEEQLRQAQKLEAVGQLAGGMAHDLNNLLTVITGFTALAAEGLEADPEAARSDLEHVRTAADRAAALTRQVLAFSRRQTLQPRTVDLAVVVGGLIPLLRPLLGEAISIVVRGEPGLGGARIDPNALEQVVMNLAVNAADAMPTGGTLALEVAAEDVPATGRRDADGIPPGPYVRLAVADTGSGMDAETRAHAFEPFFTTKAPGRGTGMGLAMVYGIVTQSGGHVRIDSEPGQGTRVSVWLPAVRPDPPVAPETAVAPISPGRTGTILLAEDERDVRAFARRVLESRGYTVLEAASGAEALELAADACRIDLIVTDVVMPRIGGPELAARLAESRPGIPVIYVSGFAERQFGTDSAALSGGRFLPKPFSSDALAAAVEEAMG